MFSIFQGPFKPAPLFPALPKGKQLPLGIFIHLVSYPVILRQLYHLCLSGHSYKFDIMDISDDSDFYGNLNLSQPPHINLPDIGDEETVMNLQQRVQDFDVDAWMFQQQENPGRAVPRSTLIGDTSHLHNPYAGVPYAWQLTETVDEFLVRLPPKTTELSEETPWIFICNPYIPRVEKAMAQNQLSKGNEDEAPEEEGSRTALVIEGGHERLQIASRFIQGIPRNVPISVQEREANKEKKSAAEDILQLAHAAKVRAGKVRRQGNTHLSLANPSSGCSFALQRRSTTYGT